MIHPAHSVYLDQFAFLNNQLQHSHLDWVAGDTSTMLNHPLVQMHLKLAHRADLRKQYASISMDKLFFNC